MFKLLKNKHSQYLNLLTEQMFNFLQNKHNRYLILLTEQKQQIFKSLTRTKPTDIFLKWTKTAHILIF